MPVVDKTSKDMATVAMATHNKDAGAVNKESERALTG